MSMIEDTSSSPLRQFPLDVTINMPTQNRGSTDGRRQQKPPAPDQATPRPVREKEAPLRR